MTTDEEILHLRQRVHDLADGHQKMLTDQRLQDLTLAQIRRDVDHVKTVSATSAQLQNAVEIFTLKLDAFSDSLKAHNRIITWTVALVMSMVVGAVIQTVLK